MRKVILLAVIFFFVGCAKKSTGPESTLIKGRTTLQSWIEDNTTYSQSFTFATREISDDLNGDIGFSVLMPDSVWQDTTLTFALPAIFVGSLANETGYVAPFTGFGYIPSYQSIYRTDRNFGTLKRGEYGTTSLQAQIETTPSVVSPFIGIAPDNLHVIRIDPMATCFPDSIYFQWFSFAINANGSAYSIPERTQLIKMTSPVSITFDWIYQSEPGNRYLK